MTPGLSPGMRQYYAQNPQDNPFGQQGGPVSGLRTTSQYRMPQGHAYGFFGQAPGQGQGQGQGHAALGGLAYAQASTLRRPTYFQPSSRPMGLSGGLGTFTGTKPPLGALGPSPKPTFGPTLPPKPTFGTLPTPTFWPAPPPKPTFGTLPPKPTFGQALPGPVYAADPTIRRLLSLGLG